MTGTPVRGRTLIETACRAPMKASGWMPRASGWFTRTVAEGVVASVAIGSATKRHKQGQASATAYVGIRVEEVETIASELCGTVDGNYRQRTAVRPIGYLMPDARWKEWLVTAETVEHVAQDLTTAINRFGLPWIQRQVTDEVMLLESVEKSAGSSQAIGRCRQAVMLHRVGLHDEALSFVNNCAVQVDGLDGAWAEREQKWLAAFELRYGNAAGKNLTRAGGTEISPCEQRSR